LRCPPQPRLATLIASSCKKRHPAVWPKSRQHSSRSSARDHTQANKELQQIAQQENVTLPTQPTGKDAAATKKLSGLNSTAFDKAYMQDQLSDHQQVVSLFRKEASSGQDPALKAFAQKTLPILQQHLQMAEALNSKG
jgi:putative membrane protein